jgi:RND family efflux transporter MFP subunit
LTLLGTALAMTARSDSATETERPHTAPRRVEVAAVEVQSTDRSLRLPGVTRSAERAQLSFSIPARVASRPVEVGDRVPEGAIVATLDAHEFQIAEQASAAALAELEVRLAQAEREQQRTERLAAVEAATVEELEQTRAAAAALASARDAAAARLAEARRLLAESTLRAPFAGTVSAVHVEPGEWASPGRPVIELSGSSQVEIMVEVPESAWTRLEVGQPVAVQLPFLGIETEGRISRLSSVAGGPGGLFPVEITLADHDQIVAGLAAQVTLPLESQHRTTVPLRSVLNPGSSRPAVFRVVDGRAERVWVTIGQVVGDRVTVDGALREGDLVATAGHTALADRDPVEVF